MSESFRLLTRFDINTMPWSAMTRRQRALRALVAEYRREHCRRYHDNTNPRRRIRRVCGCWENDDHGGYLGLTQQQDISNERETA